MIRQLSNLNFSDNGQPVFIIAEVGKNFIQTKDDRPPAEYLQNAKELIHAAKAAGADAVKFQTHTTEDEQLNFAITSPHFDGSDRYSWVKRNTKATPVSFWQEIKRYCAAEDIIFFSTPMSRGAAMLLNQIDVPLWKVASGDILDFVLLDYIAATDKPIIISSGMSTPAELDFAIAFLKKRTDNLFIMHCVSKYPCPADELYLETIPHLAKRYGLTVGFSDHSLGHEAAVAAVQKGARIIEKHFTLNRSLWGSDHKVSLTPVEFRRMVDAIRSDVVVDPVQFGRGVKALDERESMFRPVFRKSLVAGQDIVVGTVITKEMLYAMRPQPYAGGLPSEEYENVLGTTAAKDLKKYEPISKAVIY